MLKSIGMLQTTQTSIIDFLNMTTNISFIYKQKLLSFFNRIESDLPTQTLKNLSSNSNVEVNRYVARNTNINYTS